LAEPVRGRDSAADLSAEGNGVLSRPRRIDLVPRPPKARRGVPGVGHSRGNARALVSLRDATRPTKNRRFARVFPRDLHRPLPAGM